MFLFPSIHLAPLAHGAAQFLSLSRPPETILLYPGYIQSAENSPMSYWGSLLIFSSLSLAGRLDVVKALGIGRRVLDFEVEFESGGERVRRGRLVMVHVAATLGEEVGDVKGKWRGKERVGDGAGKKLDFRSVTRL